MIKPLSFLLSCLFTYFIMPVISGKDFADTIYDNLKSRIEKLKSEKNIVAGLAVILVGQRIDSQTYVNMKRKKCQELGINSIERNFDESVSQEELITEINKLNEDVDVHGILIQLPLPKHIDEAVVLNKVSYQKDVDGFHDINIASLTLARNVRFVPCTPEGCMDLIMSVSPDGISGKNAVVVGRSRIVGRPMAMLLLLHNATVTVCHSRTKDLERHLKEADIVVAACGQPQMIKGDWIKEGAIVIDVGINSVEDSSKARGYRLVGDVDFESVKEKAGFITPVPRGVGPMTIAKLMEHTVISAEMHC